MKIMLMAQHYAPEEISGAVLATELASDLVAQGHQVRFVTCAPSYPYGCVYSGYHNRLLVKENRNGLQIVRIWSYISPNRGFGARLFNLITFSINSFWGGLVAGKPDVIYSYSPPLPLGISAWLLSLIWRVPWVMRIEDLFPDAVVAAGLLRSKIIIWFLYEVEGFLYGKATHISLISEGFHRILLKKGVSKDKLSVTPVWVDPLEVQPLPKENDFRKEHDLSGKFVLLYAGNMGQTSALEDVLSAAALLSAESNIRFVFVGEGAKKKILQESAQRLGLKNIVFLPYQAREKYATVLAAADIGMVTLNTQSSSFSLPFKTFSIMASARPVLAVSPGNSEIVELLKKHNCGVNVLPSDPDAFSQTVRDLMQNVQLLEKWGKNGRDAIEHEYSRFICTKDMEQRLAGTIRA